MSDQKPFPGTAQPQQNQPDKHKQDQANQGRPPAPEARDEKTGERERSKEND